MTPLALEMLIYYCTRSQPAAGPFPNERMEPQKEILRNLRAKEVLVEQQVGDGNTYHEATAKGQAWLAMILETPLPVQQWIDPRAGSFTVVDLAPGQRLADVVPVPRETPLPDGFTAFAGALPAGTLPVGLQRDTEIEVVWRNGKRKFPVAGSVNWTSRNKPDDVIGYRVLPEDRKVS